jgi:DNA-binding HxlR family transcriptional regulator
MAAARNNLHDRPTVARMVEDIVGCKWSLAVLGAIAADIRRPGEIARTHEGLTTKVLNERLRKLMRFGIVEKTVLPVSPPHVEYRLTPFGRKFTGLLGEIERLDAELSEADPMSP